MSLTPPPIPEGFLSRWCDVLSDASESPPGAFLPSGLAMLSAIAGPRLVMRWGVAHEERMNLWVLNVGTSALARKTSGMSGMRKAVEWVKGDDLIRTVSFARLSDAGLVSALDVVTGDTAAKAADAEEYPTGTKNKDKAPPPEPVVREVPLSWIATFNEVAPIWTDEGTGWAMDAQRVMLDIYDGQLSSSTKATSVPSQACFVTAIGNIPPGVLREKTTLGMLSSGFVGRWLVVPTPEPTQIVSFPMPNGTDPLNRLRGDIEHLYQTATKGARYVVNNLWTPDALYLRDEWYRGHVESLRGSDPDDPFAVASAELFGRLQATAVKVATLLAVGRMGHKMNDLSELRVDVDDVAWASTAIDASIEYVTELLRDAGAEAATPSGKVEGRVLRYVEKAGAFSRETALTVTKVADGTKGGQVSRGDVIRTIEALLSTGHLSFTEGPITRGGVPSRLVWIGES